MKENFERRVSRWDVTADDGQYNLFHDGYAESPVPTPNIDNVAEQMAGLISRTIKAMPKNNCSRITLVALWE